MKTNRILMSVAGVALMVTPALASVPMLSGKYAANYNGTCQAVESTGKPGLINKSVFIITFTPNPSYVFAGAVHTDGSRVHGDLMVLPGRAEGMSLDPETRDTNYSNSDTTVVFGDEKLRVVYGPTNAAGIAQSLLLVGIHGPDGPDSHCAVSFVLIHQ